jgi:hypothetical protein
VPRNRRPIVRAQSARRKRVWARENFVATPSGAGDRTDLLGDYKTRRGITSIEPGCTIGGLLLDYTVVQTNGRAAPEDGFNLGIIVEHDDPTGGVPAPGTVAGLHADWMWLQWIGAPALATGSTTSTFQNLGGPIRVRSMRRMDEVGMNLFLVLQSRGLTAYTVTGTVSTLLLMP